MSDMAEIVESALAKITPPKYENDWSCQILFKVAIGLVKLLLCFNFIYNCGFTMIKFNCSVFCGILNSLKI